MTPKNHLSDSELAAVDSMIAYLQSQNKSVLDSTLDSIFQNSVNCFAAPVTVAQIAKMTIAPIHAVTASTCISGLIGMGAGGMLKDSGVQLQSLFDKLTQNGKHDELTLDDLIAIRNNNKGA